MYLRSNKMMIGDYKGHYTYSKGVVEKWDSTVIGVYYCGYISENGGLKPLYIGKATGEGGIRSRLLQHLAEDEWVDVTHFGYCTCSTANETESFEAEEIEKFKPKYNKQGK